MSKSIVTEENSWVDAIDDLWCNCASLPYWVNGSTGSRQWLEHFSAGALGEYIMWSLGCPDHASLNAMQKW
jgi:hypothetical protein